jgi:hypothetical protein
VIEGLDCCDQLVSTLGQVFGLLATNGAAQVRGTNHLHAYLGGFLLAIRACGCMAPPLEPEPEVFQL